MKHETILSNARIVGREEIPRGSVLIRDGLIADISSGASAAQPICCKVCATILAHTRRKCWAWSARLRRLTKNYAPGILVRRCRPMA